MLSTMKVTQDYFPPFNSFKNKFYGVLDSMLSFLKEWYCHTSIHLLVILHSENKKPQVKLKEQSVGFFYFCFFNFKKEY